MHDNVAPLSIAPENALRHHYWNLWEAWEALERGKLPHHSATLDQLRLRSGYAHHIQFLDQLPRSSSVDRALIETALRHVRDHADTLKPLDGSRSMRADWPSARDAAIQTLEASALQTWFRQPRYEVGASKRKGTSPVDAAKTFGDEMLDRIVKHPVDIRAA